MKFVFAFVVKVVPVPQKKKKILNLLFQVRRTENDNKMHYLYLVFSCAFC